jgi:BirA family biotin operon repressor/biotin-[acetyl-CoA-carboxylase] ligase
MKKIHYKKIDSTQKEVWRRLENGIIISADVQTNGIGTHGRTWYTTQKGNIAFSIGGEPNVPVKQLGNITIEIAKIVLEVFARLYQIELEIKHPNDIMINNKKVGGILTETKLQGEIVKQLVIGIGINTNNEEI